MKQSIMKIEKLKIKNLVLVTLMLSMFFVFAVSKSFAAITAPTELKVPATIFVFPKSTSIGYIDTSAENKVKVCKDITCTDPAAGVIDFEISDGFPLVIDTENGISGKVFGDELGWITFNPPYGGVFFADTTTGLLKGTAWSETSGVINFSMSKQKVFIDPTTGEWNGWAWASGPYGGWIKFDCQNASCVRTTWHSQNKNDISPMLGVAENKSWSFPTATFVKAKEITSCVLNNLYSDVTNLFKKTGSMFSDTYVSLASSLMNLRNSFFGEVEKINGSAFTTSFEQIKKINGNIFSSSLEQIKKINSNAFTTSISNLKNFSDQMTKIENKTFDIVEQMINQKTINSINILNNLYSDVINLFNKTIQMASSVYNLVSQTIENLYNFSFSYIISLRTSLLEQIDNLNAHN